MVASPTVPRPANLTLADDICVIRWHIMLSPGQCVALRGRTSVTELHRSLHWLPVRQRVDYKLALITFKAWRTGCPVYIASLLNEYKPARTQRTSDEVLFTIPLRKLSLSNRALGINAPRVWNNLIHDCRASSSIACFKRNLKTELFNIVHPV